MLDIDCLIDVVGLSKSQEYDVGGGSEGASPRWLFPDKIPETPTEADFTVSPA